MSISGIIFRVFGALVFVLVVIGVFYVFQHHMAVINTCPSYSSMVLNGSRPYCVADNVSAIIINKQISSFYLNSSIGISDGRIFPLSFRFIGNDPLLSIWNQNTSQFAGGYAFITIPDTFKVHMEYTTNVPTQFIVMTDSQFAQFYQTQQLNGYVMEAQGTHISTWFNLSTGCAGYVAIIRSVSGGGFQIAPNETALYAPASAPTGACAS
jgi:hypothetical protein